MDLTGPSKLLGGKCWAKKLLQEINIGHEAISVRVFF